MKLGYSILLIYVFSLLNILSVAAQQFEKRALFSGGVGLTNSNGISVADYDLDGDPDLFITASEPFDSTNMSTWNRLLQNDGHGGYSDVTIPSQLINMNTQTKDGTNGSQMAGSWGDYDRDGYPDLFISNYGFDQLWHNEGNGTFRNVTEEAGVSGCSYCYSTNAVWWDPDNDGDLDLYVCDWINRNRFFQNNGDGSFSDVGEQLGLDDRAQSFSSIPIDLDEDGLMDLYVINDGRDNNFYRNQGTHFVNEVSQVGLENQGNGMGTDLCDINSDGYFDIYITDIYQYRDLNPFFISNGDGTFSEQSKQLGVVNTGWGWGTRFLDADHDLDEDLYLVNGFSSEVASEDRNRFFLNTDGVFSEISESLGMNSIAWGMGLEAFDYDLDGDYDLVVANRNAPPDLYENRTIEDGLNNNWLMVDLIGTTSNPHGVGAKIKIGFGNHQLHRYHSGINLFGQSIKPSHFGLSDFNQVDTVEVSWPSGLVEQFYNTQSNQLITFEEGTGKAVEKPLGNQLHHTLERAVYPSPFITELWIKNPFDTVEPFEFSLFDVSGRRVYHETIKQRIIRLATSQVAGLHGGVYFYTIKSCTTGTMITGKVAKE